MKLADTFTDYLGHLFAGRRNEARELLFRAQDKGMAAEDILKQIIWPAMEQIQKLFRADQIPPITEHMAVRINRQVADQLQQLLRHDMKTGQRMVVVCGEGESEELGAQIMVDLFDAAGWTVWFLGAGVPNDEVLGFVSQIEPEVLCVYGTQGSSVPGVRRLIDLIREVGVCQDMKILASGGVFNRAQGLAEEIGADLFAGDIIEAVDLVQTTLAIQLKSSTDDTRRGRRSPTKTKSGKLRSAGDDVVDDADLVAEKAAAKVDDSEG